MESNIAMKSKVLVSGLPGCGKTTLIERLLAESDISAGGFTTKEIREAGRRVGFRIRGLTGGPEILAHTTLQSSYRVGKYFVDINALERTIESEFQGGLPQLVVIDEIGKMELFSQQFRVVIDQFWRTDQPVIATIMSAPNAFCDRIKADKNTVMLELTRGNRDEVYARLRNFVGLLPVIESESKLNRGDSTLEV